MGTDNIIQLIENIHIGQSKLLKYTPSNKDIIYISDGLLFIYNKNIILIYDIITRECIRTLQQRYIVTILCVKDNMLIIGTYYGEIHILDMVNNYKTILVLKGHNNNPVTLLSITNDINNPLNNFKKIIISGTNDNIIRIWDITIGNYTIETIGYCFKQIQTCLVFKKHTQIFVSNNLIYICSKNATHIWDINKNYDCIKQIKHDMYTDLISVNSNINSESYLESNSNSSRNSSNTIIYNDYIHIYIHNIYTDELKKIYYPKLNPVSFIEIEARELYIDFPEITSIPFILDKYIYSNYINNEMLYINLNTSTNHNTKCVTLDSNSLILGIHYNILIYYNVKNCIVFAPIILIPHESKLIEFCVNKYNFSQFLKTAIYKYFTSKSLP